MILKKTQKNPAPLRSNRQGSANKLERITTTALFQQLGIPERQSIWTPLETLLLFCCLQAMCDNADGVEEPTDLYNSVAKFMNDPLVREKTKRQVDSKCNNLKSYAGVFNKQSELD